MNYFREHISFNGDSLFTAHFFSFQTSYTCRQIRRTFRQHNGRPQCGFWLYNEQRHPCPSPKDCLRVLPCVIGSTFLRALP